MRILPTEAQWSYESPFHPAAVQTGCQGSMLRAHQRRPDSVVDRFVDRFVDRLGPRPWTRQI